ncbi:hypothetical protein [Streptomyces sp. NPDC048172]|uniref:hypothetical protein n=1 Tax=Streptomyces sp. NPDC048172 TaxID=3365505 RepID=UPI00371C1390
MPVRVRALWGTVAVAGGVTVAGLLAWLMVADLELTAQVTGVLGSVAGVVATGVAVWQLRTSPRDPASPSVRAERGSHAARGSIRNATARATGPGPEPGAGSGSGADDQEVSARDGSIAAGGDIDGSSARYDGR